jgi:hypothetical protein
MAPFRKTLIPVRPELSKSLKIDPPAFRGIASIGRPFKHAIHWSKEEPPGSSPAAGDEAGAAHVSSGTTRVNRRLVSWRVGGAAKRRSICGVVRFIRCHPDLITGPAVGSACVRVSIAATFRY